MKPGRQDGRHRRIRNAMVASISTALKVVVIWNNLIQNKAALKSPIQQYDRLIYNIKLKMIIIQNNSSFCWMDKLSCNAKTPFTK